MESRKERVGWKMIYKNLKIVLKTSSFGRNKETFHIRQQSPWRYIQHIKKLFRITVILKRISWASS